MSAPSAGANRSRSGAPIATSTGNEGEIGVRADTSDWGLEARGVSNERRRARGDLSLKRAACERRRQSALSFDLLKEPPGLVAKRLGHRLERAGAGGGVSDESKVGFAQEDDLGIAGETPREAVRKAGRERVRQNTDAVAPAETGRECRRRAAHHVHVRVARRHHAPGAFRLHTSRARLEAAQASSTYDQAMRNARSFDNVASSSASAASRNAMRARASLSGVPTCSSRRNRATAAASAKASSCARAAASRMDGARVSNQERP